MKTNAIRPSIVAKCPSEHEERSRLRVVVGSKPSENPSNRYTRAAAKRVVFNSIKTFLALALTACGGGSAGGDGSGNHNPNDVGIGSVLIDTPTLKSSYETESSSIQLEGSSFNPTNDWFDRQPHIYRVTWANAATGESGSARVCIVCDFAITAWLIDDIPLAMGANLLTVTADDNMGNTGIDTLTVTRLVESTPPTVTEVHPSDDEVDVPPDRVSEVFIQFSEPISENTINPATILLTSGVDQPVPTTVLVQEHKKLVRLLLSSPLTHGTTYTIRVTTEVHDESGNPLAIPFTSSFTTN